MFNHEHATMAMPASAYFHEAGDYARSNTLDAYEQARELYAEVIRLYDPTW